MAKPTDESEDAKPIQRSVALPPALWARVEAYGASISAVKISFNAAIKHALTQFFDEHGIGVESEKGQASRSPARAPRPSSKRVDKR